MRYRLLLLLAIAGNAYANESPSERPLGEDLKAAFGASIVACSTDSGCSISLRSVTCDGAECRAADRWHTRSVVARGAAATRLRAHLNAVSGANVAKIDCTTAGACSIVERAGDDELFEQLRQQGFGSMKLGGTSWTGSVVVHCDAHACHAACGPGTLFPHGMDCEGAPSDLPRDRAFREALAHRGDAATITCEERDEGSNHPVDVIGCDVTKPVVLAAPARGRRWSSPTRAGTSATAEANT